MILIYWLLTLAYALTTAVVVVRDNVRATLPETHAEATAFIAGMAYMAVLGLACLLSVTCAVVGAR